MGALMETLRSWLLGTLYLLPGLVIGFTVHEFMHAALADALGDSTPRTEGRLTLNPGAHIDWIGVLMFVLLGWGYAKPVNIRPRSIRGGRWGVAAVYVVGALSNFLLAAVFYALWRVLPEGLWTGFLFYGCTCNLVQCFLNLLPIAPLDGFSLLTLVLPPKALGFVFWMHRYGYLLLLALSLFNILDWYLGITQTFALLLFGAVIG